MDIWLKFFICKTIMDGWDDTEVEGDWKVAFSVLDPPFELDHKYMGPILIID